MCRPLFPLTALAPAQVWSRSYVHGSGALTTRGASLSGDSVAMAACDEPAASDVALTAGDAPTPAGVAPPPAGDAPTPARTLQTSNTSVLHLLVTLETNKVLSLLVFIHF
jgi:hypothetical protein